MIDSRKRYTLSPSHAGKVAYLKILAPRDQSRLPSGGLSANQKFQDVFSSPEGGTRTLLGGD
jgi:hypothetical protein